MIQTMKNPSTQPSANVIPAKMEYEAHDGIPTEIFFFRFTKPQFPEFRTMDDPSLISQSLKFISKNQLWCHEFTVYRKER